MTMPNFVKCIFSKAAILWISALVGSSLGRTVSFSESQTPSRITEPLAILGVFHARARLKIGVKGKGGMRKLTYKRNQAIECLTWR